MNLFDLTGKAAVVTGASSGLGRRFAQVLAAHGADVAVVARRVDRLEQLAAEIRASGKRCIPVQCDVADEDQVAATVDKAVAEFGRLDILVNNAGVLAQGPTQDLTLKEWNKVISVNLTGVFLMAKYAGRQMIKQNYGKIVNTASISGLVGNAGLCAYNASKGGVVNLTRSLAAEWGKYNITVNAIAPGPFPSEMTQDLLTDPGWQELIKSVTVLGRPGREGELDGAVVYLASDASSYTTGVILPVDGGWIAV